MAKVVSFNKDAPSLKAQPAPEFQNFHMSVRVVHFDMGKDRDIQRIRVWGQGVTKLYQQDFESRNKFLRWVGRPMAKAADEALDRAVMSPKEKVDLPFFGEEEDLIADGFKLISGA
ncbi:hypothetical protein [Edaphobacter modestus]|uniref:Uncharacterized protein n=1 Tax=Edaphobacter modestus TaxID=388466 RepID=A0A4Q7Y013_9BACT|nr:hypothetical protein [Edaphobacter modestus]RZU29055.1 hypothetical protein BDD14_6649 [Edaphobacter modestus]